VLRSRQSLIPQVPRVRSSGTVSDAAVEGKEGEGPSSSSADRATTSPEPPLPGAEREQRLLYLRQAFCGFFRAKQGVEMQNLARVMCAILGLSPEERAEVLESIERLVPALVATSTIESLSYNFSSLFG
jgi:hypothetical protein